MDEQQPSWNGHSFTLLVFGGIVVLCSIFFILGMLVGRQQGQKIASAAALQAAEREEAKPVVEEEKPRLTFYDVDKAQRAPLEPAPAPVMEAAAKPAAAPTDPPAAPPQNIYNYQIGVFSQAARAENLLESIKKKGYKAFILAPSPGEPNPVYRVQVGPFMDTVEADSVRKKLTAEGYQPILKK